MLSALRPRLRLIHDLPVGIFLNHFPIFEGVEVAAEDLYLVAVGVSAGQRPFRDADFAADEVRSVTVAHIGDTREPCSEALPNGVFSHEAGTPGVITTGHLQDAVLRKHGHD